MRREPTTLPFRSISCPLALSAKSACASAVTTSGHAPPRVTVVTIVMSVAQSRLREICMTASFRKPEQRDGHVDGLDADERRDDAAKAIDEQIPSEERLGAQRAVGDAAQRQRDERHDD